jgi:hypothetical protein
MVNGEIPKIIISRKTKSLLALNYYAFMEYRYKEMMNREECETIGGEWVKGYRRKDGTEVHGFCRDIGEARKQGYGAGETEHGYHYYSLQNNETSSGGWNTPEEVAKSLEDFYPNDKIIIMPSKQVFAENRQTHTRRYIGRMEHTFVNNEDI